MKTREAANSIVKKTYKFDLLMEDPQELHFYIMKKHGGYEFIKIWVK